MKDTSALVIFGEELPNGLAQSIGQYAVVVATQKLRQDIEAMGFQFATLEELVEPGSIYEASAFVKELSYIKIQDGTRLVKSFTYEGFELWWLYYSSLFIYFGLPYTQHKKLLEYLKKFKNIYFYKPHFKSLFLYYFKAYGCTLHTLRESEFKIRRTVPFGVLLQILITLLCMPILMFRKYRLLVFIGDKFEKSKDYDFRMKFVYQELRERNIPFVEFIRSLESWKIVLQHAFKRSRPVIYSEGVAYIGRFLSFVSRGHRNVHNDLQKFEQAILAEQTSEEYFKFLVATHYLRSVTDDIWAMRIMKWIMRAIGIRAGLFTAALDRNFHTVLGCKLNDLPTVGILHGAASPHYNVYDFLPGFDGEKSLALDKYGVWSEWWKECYVKNGKAYRPEQLYVSGPMRPLEKNKDDAIPHRSSIGMTIKVLFISEQVAVPHEIVPYLEALLNRSDIELMITFRHYRDGFRDWLVKHRPDLLERENIKIAKSGLLDAIGANDVVVGSYSTSVLEALFQYRMPLFFKTRKWGDYYDLKEYDTVHSFFAENPAELIDKIKNAGSVSIDTLKDLQERYFGDPYKNGSKWIVDQVVPFLE